MSVTFAQLISNKRRWNPISVSATPFEFQDDSIPQVIERALALGLALEMPVGAFVGSATKGELPVSNDARQVLLSNITDETNHMRQFQLLANAYPVSTKVQLEADFICDTWQSVNAHPLLKAGLCENGVFLASLGLLLIAGGDSISKAVSRISEDEQRHVGTNRACLTKLGYDLAKPETTIDNIRKETNAWLYQGLNIDELGIDAQWMIEQADLLTYTGQASELSELTKDSFYTPDFETEAHKLYGY